MNPIQVVTPMNREGYLHMTRLQWHSSWIVQPLQYTLPDTEIIFGIDIQKKFSPSYAGIRKRIATYKRMADFSHTPETVNRRQQ